MPLGQFTLYEATTAMKPANRSFDEEVRLLTVKQAAALLCCSAANVYALIESGDLAIVQVGIRKGYRVDLRDLDDFVQGRKFRFQAPPTPVPTATLKHLKL